MNALESPQQALRQAVRLAGGQVPFARLIHRSQGGVSKMLTEGRMLAAEHVLTVERETGISRHDLRPDLYPRDEASQPHRGDDDRLDGVRA